MIKLAPLVALLVVAAAVVPASSGPRASLAIGSIQFTENRWRRGSVPTLTITAVRGRASPQKVRVLLFVSDDPDPFVSSTTPPQFVGEFVPPFSVKVVVDLHQRHRGGQVTESTPEKFVQAVLFDGVTGALDHVTNEAYLDIVYEAKPTVYDLDFSTEDDFTTPLVNGQDLSTPPEFGQLISLSHRQPPVGPLHKAPAIFDSNPGGPNARSSDPDLLVGLGNVLILQERPEQTTPGIFDHPDDSANGGTFVIDFVGFDYIEKVEPLSIDLIDVDSLGSVEVKLTDVLGLTRIFSVPSGWTGDIAVNGPPGYRTLDLTKLSPQPGFQSTATASGDLDFIPGEVERLEVKLTGSGAIDNLVFAREADPGSGKKAGSR